MQSAEFWIRTLRLEAHPEGGFYKETYRSPETVAHACLPARFSGDRNFSTSIYFLLSGNDRSRFHRIQSDELWHFHAGASLSIFVLDEHGVSVKLLGDNPLNGESLQVVVPAGSWFGARVNDPAGYTLSGCTVSPGFNFDDFELADTSLLLALFPQHLALIKDINQ